MARRVVLVTGAGRGIGRAIAEALARDGVRGGLLARTESELNETAECIRAAGGIAHAATADVADETAVARAVAAVSDALGPIDGLVNNAGIVGPIAPFWETPLAAWQRTIAVDLLGPA